MSDGVRDYTAAMHEVESNLEVRRLMLVLTNVLTPACLMAVSDCLSGADYPETVAWLPGAVLPFAGLLLAASGVLVTGVLARCHFGLVLNGTKMQKVTTGALRLAGLNWLGVTTNFVLLTALSAGLGAACGAAGLGHAAWAAPAGGGTALLLLLWLPWTHLRANRRCRALDAHWQQAEVPHELAEQHARKSLDATAADVSVVVVMAVALFAGVFNALTNLGAIPAALPIEPPPEVLKRHGFVVLCAFLLGSLLLSCRMLVRLRVALGDHSRRLAELRGEQDATAHVWRPHERTYLLYAIVLLLAAASAALLARVFLPKLPALGAAAALALAGAVWYPLVVAFHRRRR